MYHKIHVLQFMELLKQFTPVLRLWTYVLYACRIRRIYFHVKGSGNALTCASTSSSYSFFVFPARLFLFLQLPHDDLMQRVVVHRRCFALSWCTPLFLRLFLLFSALGALSGKTIFYLSCLVVSGFLSPLSDVIIQNSRLCHKGDSF